MIRIAHNLIIDRGRRSSREIVVDHVESDWRDDDYTVDAAAVAERAATRAELLDALARLPFIYRSAVVLLIEGGHGYGYEGGKMWSSHSSDNMIALVAGRAGGLTPGQHVQTTGEHPVKVLITAMNAVGVGTSTLGDITGDIPALRS